MTRETFRVTFQPEGRTVFVLQGTKLVEAAGQAGIIINQPCGGDGTCGKCRVEVLDSPPPPTPADRARLDSQQIADGWRLACQLVVNRDLVVSIPQEARFFEQMILTEGRECQYSFRPNIRKQCVSVPQPSVADQRSDLDRLKAAIGRMDLQVDLPVICALPAILRNAGHKVTVVLEDDQIQGLEAGDTTERIWGVAFDIGTTTLVGTLMNLSNGRTEAVASRTNPQVHFGDDVVSRIAYTRKHADGLDKLRKRLLGALNEMILEVCEKASAEPEHIYEVTAVGNTTMSHIFLGIDPSPIAHAPYVAVVREGVNVRAREIGLEVNQNANLYVLPNIAGFVGSDTVGVILAAGMARQEEVRMAIDIGTNGEVVVGNRHRLLACSCAAGPAFEGARIYQGMRATEGAISKVVVNEGIEVGVIGGGRPSGICGSGLVDAIAVLLDAGVIDSSGRIMEPDSLAPDTPDALRSAVVTHQGQPAVVLVEPSQTRTGEPILLTQRDVREVQLAKAAIEAGIRVTAKEFGIEPQCVHQVLLAGGFGNFIRRSSAKRLGLLPPLSNDKIEFIGNAASTGAKAALACRDCRQEAERLSQFTEYIELANRADFQAFFMEAMSFPSRAQALSHEL